MRIAITVTGKGIGMLQHKFRVEDMAGISTKTRKAATNETRTPREVAESYVHRNLKDQPVIPGEHFYGALKGAGRFHKIGKRAVTTGKGSLVPSFLTMLSAECVIAPADFEVDVRRAVNQATKGAVPAIRPWWPTWEATFEVELDEKTVDAGFFRTLVDDAGSKVGIGAFRLEKGGPFGGFVVKNWQVLTEPAKNKRETAAK